MLAREIHGLLRRKELVDTGRRMAGPSQACWHFGLLMANAGPMREAGTKAGRKLARWCQDIRYRYGKNNLPEEWLLYCRKYNSTL